MSQKEDRSLTTGLHTVSDTYCQTCNTNVGWYYHAAFEDREKYKEGKFILEKGKMTKIRVGFEEETEV